MLADQPFGLGRMTQADMAPILIKPLSRETAGTVHRDIKPANVMLAGKHAIVMDFGVAKALSDAGGENITTVGVVVGTPKYMSPEQATGEHHLDHRSDIYAIGILGYELLTGDPPFSALLTSKWVEVQVGATRSYAIWAVTA